MANFNHHSLNKFSELKNSQEKANKVKKYIENMKINDLLFVLLTHKFDLYLYMKDNSQFDQESIDKIIDDLYEQYKLE